MSERLFIVTHNQGFINMSRVASVWAYRSSVCFLIDGGPDGVLAVACKDGEEAMDAAKKIGELWRSGDFSNFAMKAYQVPA